MGSSKGAWWVTWCETSSLTFPSGRLAAVHSVQMQQPLEITHYYLFSVGLHSLCDYAVWNHGGKRGYRQKGEEAQDVRTVPVPSSKSVKTLLGELGRVIPELYSMLTKSTTQKSDLCLSESSRVVFANAAGKWENSFCQAFYLEWPFKMDEQQFGLFTLAQQLTDFYPSRVQCSNEAWNWTPDVALVSPVTLIHAVSSPPPFSMGVFALAYLVWLQTSSDNTQASTLL